MRSRRQPIHSKKGGERTLGYRLPFAVNRVCSGEFQGRCHRLEFANELTTIEETDTDPADA